MIKRPKTNRIQWIDSRIRIRRNCNASGSGYKRKKNHITIPPDPKDASYRLYPFDFLRFLNRKCLPDNHGIYRKLAARVDFIDEVPFSSDFYECLLKNDAAAEKCTDRIRQQKKKILHKLCIDMERSEYTSFSMLAILKCEFQWTSLLMSRYMDSRG